MRVINFSGGQSSALMTILLEPTDKDIVLFTDTGREHSKTYEFIKKFEEKEKIKVHTTIYEKNGLYGFNALIQHKKYLPNREKRICTEELKIKTAKRYLRFLGIQKFDNYIGFRYDEEQRVKRYESKYKKVTPVFPLYKWGITKNDVNLFWEKKDYKLEIPSILGNCTMCFLKGKNALIRIMQNYPELAQEWIKDEQLTKERFNKERFSTYIKNVTYEDLMLVAKSQLPFKELENLQPAFNCSCTT